MPPGSARASRRAATLTPSPKMLPSFTITSPTLMPMRSIIVASGGSARLARGLGQHRVGRDARDLVAEEEVVGWRRKPAGVPRLAGDRTARTLAPRSEERLGERGVEGEARRQLDEEGPGLVFEGRKFRQKPGEEVGTRWQCCWAVGQRSLSFSAISRPALR